MGWRGSVLPRTFYGPRDCDSPVPGQALVHPASLLLPVLLRLLLLFQLVLRFIEVPNGILGNVRSREDSSVNVEICLT